ncbi:MAG: hypothetical protein Q8K26_03685, partial [Candidatus Gracilibacteria bacterium]|nr:hypothetical protein [Candidatus Gracilibacteria bacterium]
MSIGSAPSKSPDTTPVLVTPEQPKTLSDRPFMAAVRASTAAALLNLGMAIASPALAKGELSPYLDVADASGGMILVLKDTGDQIVPLMQSKGFAQSNINIVRDISDMIRKGKDVGLLQPGEYIGVVTVDPVSPNGGGLDGLINGGSKLPKQSFEAVTKASTLTRENYAQVVEALFDPSDVGLWMGGDEKEKTNYTGSLTSQKNRWLKKITELETSGKGDIITEWFDRFNALTKNIIHGSREEFRRGFIASLSMAQYGSADDKTKKDMAPLVATQSGEYILMTNPGANLIKVEQSYTNATGNGMATLMYLIPSDTDLDRLNFSTGKQAVAQTFETWRTRQVKTIELVEKDKKLDTRKGELDTRKGELDTRKGELDTR